MQWMALRALVRKDLLLFFSDRRAVIMGFIAPIAIASFFGLLPGTAAIVILGDALTGNVSPLLFLVSAITASLGVAGLVYEVRSHRRQHRQADAVASAGPPAP